MGTQPEVQNEQWSEVADLKGPTQSEHLRAWSGEVEVLWPALETAIGQYPCMLDRLAAAVVGAAVTLGAWLLFLPWDLSEVDADGRLLEKGADDYGGMIALVAVVVVAVAVGLLLAPRTRQSALWLAVGGLGTWAVLFTWRAGVSETSGANMFMIPLLFAVIPVTVAVPFVLRYLTYRLEERL